MSFESALTLFIAIFIFAITPGPGILALLARSLTSSRRVCITLAFGMAISDVVYLIFACYGLAAIAENWNEAFVVIRIVGAVYLLILGWKMWTASSDTTFKETGNVEFGVMKSFMQGILISASNPKVILFYIAFLPNFIDLGSLSQADVVLASAITMVSLMAALLMLSFGAASARKLFRSKKAVKRLNRTAGSIMFGAGSYLAVNG
ncbi:MAG: LysE family translocator [Proteobacteria bacterium]|nr:LysE family translocator [Pseudomonadota bacterium]